MLAKDYKKKQYDKRCSSKKKNASIKKAKAPYNFVPLNKEVIPGEKLPDFDRFHSDRYSGYIEITIETLTPLFISEGKVEGEKEEKFFTVAGKPKIPGSSIRGMVRTLVEIVSYGKFKFFEDKRLYYRGLADVKSLRELYNRKIKPKKAGFLRYNEEKQRYEIQPAKKRYNEEKQRYEIQSAKKFEQFNDNSKEFYLEVQKDGSVKVWSGKMPNKKKNWIVFPPDENKDPILLRDEDIKDYIKDKNFKILTLKR